MPRSTALFRNKSLLEARLKEIPLTSGVYRFYDVSGGLIYVGKSVRLRERVRSYFSGKADTKKLRRLRQEIHRIEWEETGSELEALLLESRLVKQMQPRFNVLLKGFVPLPYVRVDLSDPFPRLEITRQPEKDGAAYFGPFRRQETLEAGIGALSDALRLRDCPGPGERLPGSRPCHRYEFGTCSAPCLGEISSAEYRVQAAHACRALEGEQEQAIGALHARMERAAERLQFEIAARLRDAVRHIQAIAGRQHALRSAVHSLSLVAACPSRKSDGLCLFVFRSGRMVFQEDLLLADLAADEQRQSWAIRLALAHHQASAIAPERIDSALLDEIQIVTAWMKQRTREGSYLLLEEATDPEAAARALESWLRDLLVARSVPEAAAA